MGNLESGVADGFLLPRGFRELNLYPLEEQECVAIGLLLVAFVVVHVESHLANLTVEASFMPILRRKEKQKNKYLTFHCNTSCGQSGQGMQSV